MNVFTIMIYVNLVLIKNNRNRVESVMSMLYITYAIYIAIYIMYAIYIILSQKYYLWHNILH